MRNKRLTTLFGLLLLLVAAACSSQQLPEASASSPASSQAASQAQNQPADSIEGRLAMGTLRLEGGELAVTAAQAADLLPLWKAVKSLSASQTASAEEIAALYAQIEESMTADQLQAIQGMALGQEEMAALMETYGVQMQAPQGSAISEEQRATRIAQVQAEGGATGGRGQAGGFAGGGPPEGGFPGGGMPLEGGGWADQASPGAQRTAVPGQGGRAGRGMNTLFVDPLIRLLEERAGM